MTNDATVGWRRAVLHFSGWAGIPGAILLGFFSAMRFSYVILFAVWIFGTILILYLEEEETDQMLQTKEKERIDIVSKALGLSVGCIGVWMWFL